MKTKYEISQKYVEGITPSEYQKRVDEGEYKPVDEYTRWDPEEMPHITILTDEYLMSLLFKVQDGMELTVQETADLEGMPLLEAYALIARGMHKIRKNKKLKEAYNEA